jgi:DNA-binding transcriptional MocR family regulator
MSSAEYLKLADDIASDISAGRLKTGDRLPPQREFAYRRKIAVSTASRVYTELLRRGLVVGEVGRGTFVSERSLKGAAAAIEPSQDSRIDLEFNYPILPDQAALMAKSLGDLVQSDQLQRALKQSTSGGEASMREICAPFLGRGGWTPDPAHLAFTGNGRQSITAAFGALVPTGARCGVEALTYPYVKGAATRLGISLVPLSMDDKGVRPDAIEKAYREAKLSAIYIQPALHNPLGISMNEARRQDIVRLARKLDLTIIEDAIYSFLGDEVPLAALAPENCVILDSMSKRVAPGVTLGFIVAPSHLRESIQVSIRSGGWTAPGFAFAAAERMIADGTAALLQKKKRDEAARRQALAAELLAGFDIQSDARTFHLWLTLPEHWRSQAFVAAAGRRGIALTPSSAFAVTPGHAPNAIRLALATPPYERLGDALRTLAGMLSGREEDFSYTE